jgi:multidrug efflux pump subunit AcrA (membrane-fusion protein)
MEIVACVAVAAASCLAALYAVRRRKSVANAAKIRGELRNVRISRPLYKDAKRKGTRLDFDVTIWNDGREADFLESITAVVDSVEGTVYNRVVRPQALGKLSPGGMFDAPVKIYIDDVPTENINVQTLSVCTKDQSGRTHVFIQE